MMVVLRVQQDGFTFGKCCFEWWATPEDKSGMVGHRRPLEPWEEYHLCQGLGLGCLGVFEVQVRLRNYFTFALLRCDLHPSVFDFKLVERMV